MSFAERFAMAYRSVDAAFMAEIREHFSESEIAELGMMIAQYVALGRLLVVTGGDKLSCELYVPDA